MTTILIHNAQTGEIVEREMTKDELAKYKVVLAEVAERKAEAEAKATARQVILDRLGLTADEAKLLLG